MAKRAGCHPRHRERRVPAGRSTLPTAVHVARWRLRWAARRHLVRYAGVFAPRAKLRAAVVARAPANAAEHAAAPPDTHASLCSRRRPSRLPWADLLRRVFAEDVLACHCGGRRRVIAFITDRDVARRILDALGIEGSLPSFIAARAPPQPSLDDWLDPSHGDDDHPPDVVDGHPHDDVADPPPWDDADIAALRPPAPAVRANVSDNTGTFVRVDLPGRATASPAARDGFDVAPRADRNPACMSYAPTRKTMSPSSRPGTTPTSPDPPQP